MGGRVCDPWLDERVEVLSRFLALSEDRNRFDQPSTQCLKRLGRVAAKTTFWALILTSPLPMR